VRRRKVAVAGSHLKAVAPGLDSATATSIPLGIKHQPARREGGPPSFEEGSIEPRHQGGTTGPDLAAVGCPRTRNDGSKRGADDAEGAAGACGPVLLQRGDAARVASSVPGLPYSSCEEDDTEGERQQLRVAEEEDPTSSLAIAREVVPALGRQASPACHRRSFVVPTETNRISVIKNPTLCTSVIVPGRGYHVQSLCQVVQIHTTRE
jgi:hypothetical protein